MNEDWQNRVSHPCGVAGLVAVEEIEFSVPNGAESYDTTVIIAVCSQCGAVLFVEVGEPKPFTGRSGLEDSVFLRVLRDEVTRLSANFKARGIT